MNCKYYAGENALKGKYKQEHIDKVIELQLSVDNWTYVDEVAEDLYENLYRYQLEGRDPKEFFGEEKEFIKNIAETYSQCINKRSVIKNAIGDGLVLALLVMFSLGGISLSALVGVIWGGIYAIIKLIAVFKFNKSNWSIEIWAAFAIPIGFAEEILKQIGVYDPLALIRLPEVLMWGTAILFIVIGVYLKRAFLLSLAFCEKL